MTAAAVTAAAHAAMTAWYVGPYVIYAPDAGSKEKVYAQARRERRDKPEKTGGRVALDGQLHGYWELAGWYEGKASIRHSGR